MYSSERSSAYVVDLKSDLLSARADSTGGWWESHTYIYAYIYTYIYTYDNLLRRLERNKQLPADEFHLSRYCPAFQ